MGIALKSLLRTRRSRGGRAGNGGPAPTGVLGDIRILAVEQFGAGPFATAQLADLGADVIKVEDPNSGGDVGRYVPPYAVNESSIYFESFNRGKRSISLDLRTAAGREAFEALVPHIDGVYCNLRGDQPEKLRLTYSHLGPLNPKIVCCSLSGYGRNGPLAAEGAYDYVLQGMAGWMSLTGGPDAPPTKSGLSLVDFCGGYVSALALLSGIWAARRTGIGCDCDLSLFDTALAELTYVGAWVASRGYEPERLADSAHPSIVPFQAFRTLDGYVMVACPKQRFWERLCKALERPELATQARFADFAARSANRAEMLAELEPLLSHRSTAELLALLRSHGVPAGPVNTVSEALQEPQALARGSIVRYEHPELGEVALVASPLRVGSTPTACSRAPFRGEHTVSVMREVAKLPPSRIDELRLGGAFGEGFEGAS